jgi:hypothetical protein
LVPEELVNTREVARSAGCSAAPGGVGKGHLTERGVAEVAGGKRFESAVGEGLVVAVFDGNKCREMLDLSVVSGLAVGD